MNIVIPHVWDCACHTRNWYPYMVKECNVVLLCARWQNVEGERFACYSRTNVVQGIVVRCEGAENAIWCDNVERMVTIVWWSKSSVVGGEDWVAIWECANVIVWCGNGVVRCEGLLKCVVWCRESVCHVAWDVVHWIVWAFVLDEEVVWQVWMKPTVRWKLEIAEWVEMVAVLWLEWMKVVFDSVVQYEEWLVSWYNLFFWLSEALFYTVIQLNILHFVVNFIIIFFLCKFSMKLISLDKYLYAPN